MRNKDEEVEIAWILEGFPDPCGTLLLPMLPGRPWQDPLCQPRWSQSPNKGFPSFFSSFPSRWRQLGAEEKEGHRSQLDLGVKPGAGMSQLYSVALRHVISLTPYFLNFERRTVISSS